MSRKKGYVGAFVCMGLFVGLMGMVALITETPQEPVLPDNLPVVVRTPSPSTTASATPERYALPLQGERVWEYSLQPIRDRERNLWQAHPEVDIKAEEGARVVAAAAGTVQRLVRERGLWTLYMQQEDGMLARYAGLSEASCLQTEGKTLERGQEIGTLDVTGVLHFALQSEGEWVDPIRWSEE